LKAFSGQSFCDGREHKAVRVTFDEEMVRYLGDQQYYRGWVSEETVDGGVKMTFLTSSIAYFARWLLMWGDWIEVIAPPNLQKKVQSLSEQLYRHHSC